MAARQRASGKLGSSKYQHVPRDVCGWLCCIVSKYFRVEPSKIQVTRTLLPVATSGVAEAALWPGPGPRPSNERDMACYCAWPVV